MTTMPLSKIATHHHVIVAKVLDKFSDDPIAARLRDLGFVEGEPIRLTATGPFGGSPLLIAIGNTRFALRRQEAERVLVRDLSDHE